MLTGGTKTMRCSRCNGQISNGMRYITGRMGGNYHMNCGKMLKKKIIRRFIIRQIAKRTVRRRLSKKSRR